MKSRYLLFVAAALTALSSCRKPEETVDPTPSADLTAEIMSDLSTNVIRGTYNDLKSKADQLNMNVQALNASITENNLTACKQSWRDCRAAWEQSESFLFGPVATENIDPRIDTWPVNFNDLDSILTSNSVFTAGYIDSLDDALKGFHPIEYLLFGTNGNKTASQLTARELEYLVVLTGNLNSLTTALSGFWDPAAANNFHAEFNAAGSGSTVYPTRRSAYEEMVNSMAGICDEVANGKMTEPFILQDPSLEESPFAFNSMTDFTNNIRGVQNIYLGTYSADGKGIEDLVRANNLSLDQTIKQKIDAAIATLNTVTVPFGQAITQQPVQVQNCINAINDLKTTIENDLLPFVQLHTN
jgi:putative iron-regulated protein